MNLRKLGLGGPLLGLLLMEPMIPALGSELAVEVLPLSHRSVEQVLPIIQPLVPKPGTVSGMAGQLVIRSTPANLREVKRVLGAIDRAPRRLLITVRQDADAEVVASALESSAAIRSRERGLDPGDVAATGTSRVGARVYSTQSATSDRNSQQVQVLEGNEASIRVGVSVPVARRDVVRESAGGRRVHRSFDSVEYRDILSGFTVRPYVVGDIVTLQLSPQHATPGAHGRGSMSVQRVSSTVSGRLGEWIEVAGASTGRAFESDSATLRSATADGAERRVLIRVEALD